MISDIGVCPTLKYHKVNESPEMARKLLMIKKYLL